MPAPDHGPALTAEEESIYAWQFDVAGFGRPGQRRLKEATVLVTRVGGLGGMVALQLAAAGLGRLILAHAGNIRPDDLNRQVLMSHAAIGRSRLESATERLRALNPRLEIIAVPENVTEANAGRLVADADVVVDCAPLFTERYPLNRAAMARRVPMVEAAVYDLEFHLTTFLPGRTGCLRCLYPEPSTTWTRRFPVFGAVAGTAGSLAALEVIKVLAGVGEPLAGRLLCADLRTLQVKSLRLHRVPGCPDCGHL
ncbi:MAG: HesA/MoeB/ThiF family protein [Verrucomicrobiota bacterium]